MGGIRRVPPRAHGPPVPVAVASRERRPPGSAGAAAGLTPALWAKSASGASSFFVADAGRLAAGRGPELARWCRGGPPSVGRRPLAGGETGGWGGTGAPPGL